MPYAKNKDVAWINNLNAVSIMGLIERAKPSIAPFFPGLAKLS